MFLHLLLMRYILRNLSLQLFVEYKILFIISQKGLKSKKSGLFAFLVLKKGDILYFLLIMSTILLIFNVYTRFLLLFADAN